MSRSWRRAGTSARPTRTPVRSAGSCSGSPRAGPEDLRWTHDDGPHPHEARYLKLDSSKARARLGWRPGIDLAATLESIVDWYGQLRDGADMRTVTLGQIETFQYAAAPS